ncbi:MAG: class I SAM-dependent methyltransferase [Candidatus Heimdallarchaeaceae archaeon]
MSEGFCPDHSPEYYEEFLREIEYTKEFRKKIYEKIGLKGARRVLEVGCRQGVISQELRDATEAQITSIDSDHMNIADNSERIKGIEFYRETADKLSMRDESFDIVVCHYFFLWKPKPFGSLMELKRVCKKGGYIVALAEPDYLGWIENPDLGLGKYHQETLQNQGGNPGVGRSLLSVFSSGGLETEIFVNTRIWPQSELEGCYEQEWTNIYTEGLITEEEYKEKVAEEKQIIENKLRIIALPIFSAIGKKVTLLEDTIDPYDDY